MLAFRVGMTLGFSLIMAIGAQNLFLIKQGVKKEFPYWSAWVCFFCDAILMFLSVTSVRELMIRFPMIKMFLWYGGILFLLVYGALSIRSGVFSKKREGALNLKETQMLKRYKVFVLALTFSFLNPQAILDTLVLVGGVANQYPGNLRYEFMFGTLLSSFVWFFLLVTVSSYGSQYLVKENNWKVLEIFSGGIMLLLALKLMLGHL